MAPFGASQKCQNAPFRFVKVPKWRFLATYKSAKMALSSLQKIAKCTFHRLRSVKPAPSPLH
jgi:hypothetical protein